MANKLSNWKLTALGCFAASLLCGCEKTPSNVTTPEVSDTIAVPASDTATAKQGQNANTVAPPKKPKVISKASKDLINYMNSSADSAKYAGGIFHRMAEDSPEYTRRLLNSEYSRFIIVDKEAMAVALFDSYGREELRYGIACARNYGDKVSKGDSRTPEGFFSAQGIYDSTDWLFTDDNGRTSQKKGQFGPRFIRISAPNTSQIGIHGTCAPGSIGRRCSHGCIRVTNQNILELVKYVTIGMPIIVSPSDKDVEVNRREGRNIAQVTINAGVRRKHITEKPQPTHSTLDSSTIKIETPVDDLPATEPSDPAPQQVPDSIN